jgi:hypothetical protein
LDERSLRLYAWNRSRSAYQALPTTVDAAANRLTAQLTDLTEFGAAAEMLRLFLPLLTRVTSGA